MPLQRHTTLPLQASWINLGLTSDSPWIHLNHRHLPWQQAYLTKANLRLQGVPSTGKGGQVEFIAYLLA